MGVRTSAEHHPFPWPSVNKCEPMCQLGPPEND